LRVVVNKQTIAKIIELKLKPPLGDLHEIGIPKHLGFLTHRVAPTRVNL
jgi:hypothetical protein